MSTDPKQTQPTAPSRPMGAGFGKGQRGFRRAPQKPVWVPSTNLGRLVQGGLITSLEQIYLHSFKIKEPEIIDQLVPEEKLVDNVAQIRMVQKMSTAGARARYVAFVIVGDRSGHVGIGSKCSKETSLAIAGATRNAKVNMIPVRLGYWNTNIGAPHTVALAVQGKCGSVRIRLIPAPRGAGIVGSPNVRDILGYAGVHDCYTTSSGHTCTLRNTITATYIALRKTYEIMTPDQWDDTVNAQSPMFVHHKVLSGETKPEIAKA